MSIRQITKLGYLLWNAFELKSLNYIFIRQSYDGEVLDKLLVNLYYKIVHQQNAVGLRPGQKIEANNSNIRIRHFFANVWKRRGFSELWVCFLLNENYYRVRRRLVCAGARAAIAGQ